MQIKQRQIIIIILLLPLVIIEQFAKSDDCKTKEKFEQKSRENKEYTHIEHKHAWCGERERKRFVSTLYRMVLLKCEQAGMQRQHIGWDT